ncbi:uncharacterized protein LOC127708967 isoform X2 [Mytilus californianus]|uniref:uncharacterized protein LOC127708967 isoform X2 n=1 Tax=Mytilus californianus TaxID=6549 RepID=UPI0022472D90|nr:uncharacterized protein LOC127708967 isoform X2 [Mytilus californianus]
MERKQKRNEKLLKAAEDGDLERVKNLVRHGADINYKDTFGSFTALHCAAKEGNVEIINYLADNEADMNCRNNRGITPVEIAAKGQNTDVFEYLKNCRDQGHQIENDLERFKMKTEEDFQSIVSQGSYQSHENRIYLVGPYNVGKTTIAAVLVNDEIPKERCPTNGIWVHLRRAGMNIEKREWVFYKSEISKSSSVLEGFLMSVNYSGIAPKVTTTIYERSGRTANKYATDCETVDEPARKKLRLAKGESEVCLESSQVSDTRHTLYSMIGATHTQMYNRIKEMLQNGQYEEKIAPVDIWDFGGQDVYYVTHQLFICYRGTFLLVFDGSKQMDDPLDVKSYLPGISEYPTTSVYLLHWVNSILTYCKNTKDGYPKILFVATHKDLLHQHNVENRRREITRSLEILFQKHSGRHHLIFNPLIFVNATDKSDREMRMVKDQIVSIAFSHPKWGEPMPVAWITLELQIALRVEKGEFVLTKDALIAINTHETSVTLNEQALETFLKIQNSLGKIIYFNVKKLNKYIIINPLCLIQVLKSIVTIREHWPSGPDFSRTLLELSSKGIISKKNIFQIWQQPEFCNILPYKDFMIDILCHLDILVAQKRYDNDTDDQVIERYLVPSMITTPCKSEWIPEMISNEKSLCLIYNFEEDIIPTGLSYRILSSCLCIWDLKIIRAELQLFAGCAMFGINQNHDLILIIKKKQIIIYLVHAFGKSCIVRDVATSTQECLSVSIKKISDILNSAAGTSTSEMNDMPFKFQVKASCGCYVDYVKLKNASGDFWQCSQHETSTDINQMTIWFAKERIEDVFKCRHGQVLKDADLQQCPTNKQLAHLSRRLSINSCRELAKHLKVSQDSIQSIWDEYRYHVDDYKFMLLWKWKVNNRHTSLQDVLRAIKCIDEDDHKMCQIFIQDNFPIGIAEIVLNEIPKPSFLEDLINHIGIESFQLAIELDFDIPEIEIIRFESDRNIRNQTREILKRWIRRDGASVRSLVEALIHIQRGMDCVYKHYSD